ncbi:MAG: 2OG-Fe(II) oxygenase [Alphaproteobacteria bacterium]|nr:2OG-Fe(II) oxygenase [Alphaproteobacteria bacterium]
MSIFDLPDAEEIARHFTGALRAARRDDRPYTHWSLENVLPEKIAAGILMLPIAPPFIDECGGVRDYNENNKKRSFFTPELRAKFPVCEVLAEAMQRPDVARQFAETCEADVEGGFVRIEYIQDTDGAWLEPHHDVPEKLFSMVIYLCLGPDARDWGTDIYDHNRKWCGRASAAFNSAAIFIPGDNTWHGFDKRPIVGVRRLMEINYVHPRWRDKDQLSFPDRPVTIK